MQAESRKIGTFFRANGWLTLLVGLSACGLLAACGRAHSPGTVMSSLNATAHRNQKPAQPGKPDDGMTDMVAAISATKTGPPVEMKFAVQQRPEVGQPVDVSIAMIATSAALDSVSASFAATEGLDIVGGAEMPQTDKPFPGIPLHHTLRILPKRNGIFAVTAVVSVGSANTRTTRTFSIPIIAGEGMAEPANAGEGSTVPPARPEATKG